MLLVILDWLYVFTICSLAGGAVLALMYRLVNSEYRYERIFPTFVAGAVGLTIYAEFFSIFHGVSVFAHVLMLVLLAGWIGKCHISGRLQQQMKQVGQVWRTALCSWNLVLYAGIIVLVAFFASRGVQHTDTGIYHAQAVRWIEEYGVVRGLGNLMGNYAYNSSWLCLVALFSMKWLGGLSLHTLNGLLSAGLVIYSLSRLSGWKSHKTHGADGICIAMIFYSVVTACTIMSPATDAPTLFFAMYFIELFAEEIEKLGEQDEEAYVRNTALISIGMVYVATLKFSAACSVLMVISPAIFLLRGKKWKQIGIYFGTGSLVLLPFLLRNVILSGWLLYPFQALDLFPVSWKIPYDSVVTDAVQIQVYGRCLFENELYNLPLKEWLPIWWGAQENYEQLLIAAAFMAMAGSILLLMQKILQKDVISVHRIVLHATCIVSIGLWLFTAPFVRYGLGFLLAYPLFFLGSIGEAHKPGLFKIGIGGIGLCILTALMPYWNHYVTDDLVFVKHHLAEWEYTVIPKDYEEFATDCTEIDGITFYYPTEGDKTGYYGFPGAPGMVQKGQEISLYQEGNLRSGFYVE